MVSTHRRIALQALELYANKVRANRDTQLAFLAKQAQELGLGYFGNRNTGLEQVLGYVLH